jgi:hypothetical protein
VPLIPTSASITALQNAPLAPGQTGFPPTIIVRGYPGPPIEVLQQAGQILAAFGAPAIPANVYAVLGLPQPAPPPAAQPAQPPANCPWRIYLTARLDCWVEVPDWGACVAFSRPEASTDRVDAHTVWLRTTDANNNPQRYRVVSTQELDGEFARFVSGKLVENYLDHAASGTVTWDEQQFGPTTGKLSSNRCF